MEKAAPRAVCFSANDMAALGHSRYEYTGGKTIRQIRQNRTCFTGADGRSYTLKSLLGRCVLIRDDGEITFQMKGLDYAVKLSLLFSVPVLLIAFPVLIWMATKEDHGASSRPTANNGF